MWWEFFSKMAVPTIIVTIPIVHYYSLSLGWRVLASVVALMVFCGLRGVILEFFFVGKDGYITPALYIRSEIAVLLATVGTSLAIFFLIAYTHLH